MNKNAPLAVAPDPVLGSPTVRYVALAVRDVEASARWYAEKLDFKERWRLDRDGKPWVIMVEAGDIVIELVSEPGSVVSPDAWVPYEEHIDIRGCAHMSFHVEDAHATMRALAERGVRVQKHTAMEPLMKSVGGNNKGAWFWDLDGNIVQLMSGDIPTRKGNITTG